MSDYSLSFTLSYDKSIGTVTLKLDTHPDQPQVSQQTIYAELCELAYNKYFIFEDKINDAIAEASRLTKLVNKLYAQHQLEPRETSSEKAETCTLEETYSDTLPSDDQPGTNEQINISAKQLLESINDCKLAFIIAERRDAQIRLDVSEDRLKAYLSIDPPHGGVFATETKIKQAIGKSGICYGIIEQAIQKACAAESCDRVLIAKASKPKRGKPSQFKPLVGEQIGTNPGIEQQGHAPLHGSDIFLVVEPGTPLMKRTKPGAGKPGTDVYGNTIPAIPGDVLPFSTDIEGASISENSSDTLVAKQLGHPVFRDRGVSVSEVLSLENINTNSRDIEFDGSVFVKGDIADGVKLSISGDLAVKGGVGNASITAGGSIFIHQGLSGTTEVDGSDDSHLYAANINAKESVHANSITHARITAGKHIISNDYIHNSDLTAGHKILVGQHSNKGELSGGSAQAFDLIAANVIGNREGTPTYLKVGAEGKYIFDLRLLNKEKRVNFQNTEDIIKASEKIALLEKSVGLMTPQMEAKLAKLNDRLKALQIVLNELNEQEEAIKRILMKSKKSRVSAQQNVFHNTVVSILGSEYKISEDLQGGSFRFDARKVLFEPLHL